MKIMIIIIFDLYIYYMIFQVILIEIQISNRQFFYNENTYSEELFIWNLIRERSYSCIIITFKSMYVIQRRVTLEQTIIFQESFDYRFLLFFIFSSQQLLTESTMRNKFDSKEREKRPQGGSNVQRMALIRPAIKLGLHWIGRTVCPELNGYTQLRLLRPLWPNVMPFYGPLQRCSQEDAYK